MNGNQVYAKISEDLTTLKTMVEERWNAHDKSACIGRKQLDKQLEAIFTKLDTLTPVLERINGIQSHISRLWTVTTVILIAILGLATTVIMGG